MDRYHRNGGLLLEIYSIEVDFHNRVNPDIRAVSDGLLLTAQRPKTHNPVLTEAILQSSSKGLR